MKIFWRLFFISLVCFFSACEQAQVAENLPQAEAHEIIAVLSQAGVPSQSVKGKGSGAGYAVEVSRSDYLASITLLNQQGLPRPAEKSFSDLVTPQGLLPNSREFEAIRIDHAMARELEETLSTMAGVISAKAIVRLHFANQNSNQPQVAVVLKTKANAEVSAGQVSRLIQSVFPGIPTSNVVVEIAASSQQSNLHLQRVGLKNTNEGLLAVPLVHFLFFNIPGDEHSQLAVTLLVLLAAALILGILLGYYYAFFYRFGKEKNFSKRQKQSSSNFDDFAIRNLPEK